MNDVLSDLIITFTLTTALALAFLLGVLLLGERSRIELRRQADWLSTMLRSIGEGVIATDNDGRVLFMNAVAEKLTGWTEDQARRMPLEEILRITTESTGNAVESPITKLLRDGSGVCLANQPVLTAKDGTQRPI